MLHLRAFLPSSEKVRQVELHPVQPWIAAVTKADHICVWDWNNQQVIQEFQLGGSEDEMLQDLDISKANIKDPSFQPNPSLYKAMQATPGAGGPSHSSTGKVKDIKFLDMEVAQVQLTTQHYLVNGTSSPPPSAEHAAALRGHRLLLVVCEHKAMVFDLLTKHVTEVPKGSLEGKAPTCVSLLFLEGHAFLGAPSAIPTVMKRPALAFGCTDGIVRVLQYGSFTPMARLVSGHKSAIMCVTTLQSRGCQWEQVVAGHSYGSLCSWEPFSRMVGATDMPCKLDVKAHDKDIVGLALACVQEDPEQLKRVLFTAGVDNRLMGWDPVTLKEVSKSKLDSKAQTTCMAASSRGFVANGTHTLLVGTEVGVLLSLHAVTGSTRLVCNLAGIVPQGAKKQPKLYWVAVHPLQPQYVAVGTNTGTALLSLESVLPLPATPLPLLSPMQAHQIPVGTAAGRAKGAGSGMTYLLALGDAVTCVTCSTLEQEVAAQQKNRQSAVAAAVAAAMSKAVSNRAGPVGLEQLLDDEEPAAPPQQQQQQPGQRQQGLQWDHVHVVSRVKVAGEKPTQRAVITTSYDGAYAAVVWPALRQYALYRQGAAAWEEISSGSGSSIAWHSSRHLLAVLEDGGSSGTAAAVASATASSRSMRRGPSRKSREGEAQQKEEARRQASLDVAPAAVQVKEIQGRSVSTVHRTLLMAFDDRPVFVTSGPLLAVTLKKEIRGADLVAGHEGTSAMQLFTWDDASKAGPELPEPLILAWDQSLSFAALAYTSQVVLCVTKPSFKSVASLPLAGVTCMEWAARQLYLLTPTHVYVAFVGLPLGNAPSPPVHIVTLASFTDGLAPPPPALKPSPGACLLPTPAARPPGTLTLLGPRDGNLWFMNAQGQALALQLSHPGLNAMCLVAAGDVAAALKLAQEQLAPEAHDAFAAYLLDMEGERVSGSVFSLPGISLPTEARLRMQMRQWQQAMAAVETLLSGCTSRPENVRLSCPLSEAAFRHEDRAYSSRALGLSAASALDEDLFAAGTLAGASVGPRASAKGRPPFPDEFDWTLPMRQGLPPTAGAAPASRSAPLVSGRLQSPAVQTGLDLGMELVEGLAAAGQQNAARHAVRMLLQLVGIQGLGDTYACRLVLVMAEAGMKAELAEVVGLSAAASLAGQSSGSAALLAAALSGQASMLSQVLSRVNSQGLVAAHASAQGLASAATALAQWKDALAHAGCGVGAPHLMVSTVL